MKLQQIIDQNLALTLEQVRDDAQLVLEIQEILSFWGLYPAGNFLDGDFGPRTQAAVNEFRVLKGIPSSTSAPFDKKFAEAILDPRTADILLETAKDRERVYTFFRDSEAGFNADKLWLLDRGIDNSPYRDEVASYPNRLTQKPDGIQVVSFGETARVSNPDRSVTFKPYPQLGTRPEINSNGLDFLHSDIKEACICTGSSMNGEIKANWLGKNELDSVQFWSSTKMIAILNSICQVNTQNIDIDIDDCVVRSSDDNISEGLRFYDLAVDIVSYRRGVSISNSLGATFKRFETFTGLDEWVKGATGNPNLTFKGNYGQEAFFRKPELFDKRLRKTVLSSAELQNNGPNLVSAYDLTRMMSMLAWHYHIPQPSRLPGAQWHSLESVVRAMGTDSARYIDAAITRLGLQRSGTIKNVVILSKLGFGRSSSRDRTELTYSAYVQFTDRRPNAAGDPSVMRNVALTLRAAKALGDPDEEARILDARMAAEVTEILRKVVAEELG